jgi:hypothetical protein
MPLYKGEQNIGKNYRKLMEEGYSKKQATAIAIKVAGRKGGKKKQEKKKRG